MRQPPRKPFSVEFHSPSSLLLYKIAFQTEMTTAAVVVANLRALFFFSVFPWLGTSPSLQVRHRPLHIYF